MSQSTSGPQGAGTDPTAPARISRGHPYTWPLLNPLGIVGIIIGVLVFGALYGFFMRVVPAVWAGAPGWLAFVFFLFVALGMVLLLENKRPYPDRGG